MLKKDQILKNPTVIVVVDRINLDSQINTIFSNANLKNVTPINSCKKLSSELKNDTRNILITTIFKFDDVEIDENNLDGLNSRKNIIVLVDEAHRTQEGFLAEKMRWALPNAFFFGLTGTPISNNSKNTFRLFGSENDKGRYMNRYSYKQSIRDEATLPVKFEPRLIELKIDQEKIDQEFEQLIEDNQLNEEERKSLSKKAGKMAHLFKAQKRMAAISENIFHHFKNVVEPKGLKAMVVVYEREACVLMYNLLQNKFKDKSCEVIMNVAKGDTNNSHGNELKQQSSDWVNWTNNNLPLDKEDFKRWQEIDSNANLQEKVLDDFRDPNNKLKILIVTSKLLTGFDAPICYCMYLDKPLKDHTLLQAICRTNRPYNQSKQIGLIIDYLGVFENIARSLAYDPKEIEGIVDHLEKYKDQLPEALENCLLFFKGVDRSLLGYEGLIAAQECISTNAKRDQFASQFNILKKLWEALTPDKFLQKFKKDYRWLAQIYDSVRPVGGLGSLIWQSLGPDTIKLIQDNTDIGNIRDDLDELIIDKETIFKLSEADRKKRAQILEISLMAKIKKKTNDPRYIELGERLEKLRNKYESGVLTSIAWLKELLETARLTVELDKTKDISQKLIPDKKTALKELFNEIRNDKTPEIIAGIVNDIDAIVIATRFPGWQNTNSGDREMRQVLRKTLLKYQLHKDAQLYEKAYQYVRENY